MCNMKTKQTFLTVRLTRDAHQAFRAKATRFGGSSEVLRELVMDAGGEMIERPATLQLQERAR